MLKSGLTAGSHGPSPLHRSPDPPVLPASPVCRLFLRCCSSFAPVFSTLLILPPPPPPPPPPPCPLSLCLSINARRGCRAVWGGRASCSHTVEEVGGFSRWPPSWDPSPVTTMFSTSCYKLQMHHHSYGKTTLLQVPTESASFSNAGSCGHMIHEDSSFQLLVPRINDAQLQWLHPNSRCLFTRALW